MCITVYVLYVFSVWRSKFGFFSNLQLHRTATPTIPAPQPQKSAIVESKYGQ